MKTDEAVREVIKQKLSGLSKGKLKTLKDMLTSLKKKKSKKP